MLQDEENGGLTIKNPIPNLLLFLIKIYHHLIEKAIIIFSI
jgi:hypothetical protein